MTHPVPLPALDGRDPLGFLAALGAFRLLAAQTPGAVRLAFDQFDATAVLHSSHASVEEIATALHATRSGIPEEGVLPDAPPNFPQQPGRGADPSRVPRTNFRTFVNDIRAEDNGDAAAAWAGVMITDLAVDGEGRAALTPYTAPVAKQSLRSFFKKPLLLTDRQRIHEALTGWRRVDGCTGENFDYRVLREGADLPTGESSPYGVPGATWLATMALPLLRLTGTGQSPQASLWHRPPGYLTTCMVWPLWGQPLDPPAVQTLLDHPALAPTYGEGRLTVAANSLTALGVFHVAGAQRQPHAKSAGPLTQIPIDMSIQSASPH